MEKVGVLAIQGDFAEHCKIFSDLGVETSEVRLPRQLDELDGLVIPGGESTTITKLMEIYGLVEPVKQFAESGKPLWGTCAGMIVSSSRVIGDVLVPMGLIDLDVRRNAFGSQIDSFEADLPVPSIGGKSISRGVHQGALDREDGAGSRSHYPAGKRYAGSGAPGQRPGNLIPSRTHRRFPVPQVVPGYGPPLTGPGSEYTHLRMRGGQTRGL